MSRNGTSSMSFNMRLKPVLLELIGIGQVDNPWFAPIFSATLAAAASSLSATTMLAPCAASAAASDKNILAVQFDVRHNCTLFLRRETAYLMRALRIGAGQQGSRPLSVGCIDILEGDSLSFLQDQHGHNGHRAGGQQVQGNRH